MTTSTARWFWLQQNDLKAALTFTGSWCYDWVVWGIRPTTPNGEKENPIGQGCKRGFDVLKTETVVEHAPPWCEGVRYYISMRDTVRNLRLVMLRGIGIPAEWLCWYFQFCSSSASRSRLLYRFLRVRQQRRWNCHYQLRPAWFHEPRAEGKGWGNPSFSQ